MRSYEVTAIKAAKLVLPLRVVSLSQNAAGRHARVADVLRAEPLVSMSGARLQLSLLQPQGPQLTFDFDVTDAASAINAIPCEK
jgi:hypothetical protein